MEKVVLFGTSAGTRTTHFALSRDPAYEVVAFTVDRDYIREKEFCGLPVLPFEDIQTLRPPDTHKMMVAIYASRMNQTRAEKYSQAKRKGYTLITYIHPRAVVAPGVAVGDNCFISEGAICRPYLKIENDVFVMPGAILGHDTVVGEHCFIGNGAVVMGMVTLEPNCFIGPNATILENLTVGRESLIGGGVVLQESTKEKEVWKAAAPVRLALTSDKLARIIFRKTL
jgi:sugar O-acyltransferase (sialic acid O-acetyltransferase NeuD family)